MKTYIFIIFIIWPMQIFGQIQEPPLDETMEWFCNKVNSITWGGSLTFSLPVDKISFNKNTGEIKVTNGEKSWVVLLKNLSATETGYDLNYIDYDNLYLHLRTENGKKHVKVFDKYNKLVSTEPQIRLTLSFKQAEQNELYLRVLKAIKHAIILSGAKSELF